MKNKFELKIDALSGDYVVRKSEDKNFREEQKFNKFWSIFSKKPQKNDDFSKNTNQVKELGYISSLESRFIKSQNAIISEEGAGESVENYPEPVTLKNVTELLQDLSAKIRVLSQIYQQLSSIGGRFSNFFQTFIAENTSMQGVILNIVDFFDENRDQREMQMPNIGSNLNDGVEKVIDILDDTIETVLKLQRLVDIDEVERELSIINSTLNLQRNRALSILNSNQEI